MIAHPLGLVLSLAAGRNLRASRVQLSSPPCG